MEGTAWADVEPFRVRFPVKWASGRRLESLTIAVRPNRGHRIQFVEREMTRAELARENAGFDEHTREQGNPLQTSQRHTVVALDGQTFIGCASGLAYKNADD